MNKTATKNGRVNGKRIELPPVESENVIAALLNTPRLLMEATARRDHIKADHDKYLAGLSIDALTAPLFAEGEAKRPAKNDAERKQAVEKICHDEPEFRALAAEFHAAQREVEFYRNQQENVQLIARLLIHQAKQ